MTRVFFNKLVKCPFKIKIVEKVVRSAGRFEKKISEEVEVNIIGDEEMKGLNSCYRNKRKTTDVLSFAWKESAFGPKKVAGLGQIFISYPRLKKQAKERGVKIQEELARLLTHGLLHLTGYDHKLAKDGRRMAAKENEILDYAFKQNDKKF